MKKLLLVALVLAGFTLVGQGIATATATTESVSTAKCAECPECPSECKECPDCKECPAECKECPDCDKCQGCSKEWDFLQIGIWFGVPAQTDNTDVYGIRIGAPFCGGRSKVIGLETAVFCGATDYVKGAQACIITSISKKVVGFQGSIINFCDEVEGLQFGIVNVAEDKAFQLGILNFIKNSSVPFFPVINFRFP